MASSWTKARTAATAMLFSWPSSSFHDTKPATSMRALAAKSWG